MGKVAKHSKPFVIALTMLLVVKAVAACTTIAGYPDPTIENKLYIRSYLFAWLALIVGNLAIYFIRGRKGLWIVVLTAVSMVILLPLTFFIGVMSLGSECGITARTWLFYDVIVFGALFVAQLVSWIVQPKASKVELP